MPKMLKRAFLICPLLVPIFGLQAQEQSSKNGLPVEVVATASEYVPQTTTVFHPGHAYTDCHGRTSYFADFDFHGSENSGSIRGTGDISGTADTSTQCSTTFRPPSESTLTAYRKVNYTVARSGQALYLLACTAHWKPSAGTRLRAALVGGIHTDEDRDSAEQRARQILSTGPGHWSDCPAYSIGNNYTLRIHSASAAELGDSTTGKPIMLEYLKSVPVSASVALAPASAQMASAAVSSTPSGADIYLDGNFVGNTPSTLNVAGGTHSIVLKKNGFQDWTRQMSFSGGTITLSAELLAGAGVPESASTTKPVATKIATEVPATFSVQPVESKQASATTSADAPQGWIGVSANEVTVSRRGHFGSGGAVITAVVAGGPGAQAGLKAGDVINEMNGISLKDENLEQKIAVCKPGTKVRIGYMRGAWAQEATVTVGTNTK